MTTSTLLFTSGASLVGQNVLSALAARRHELHLVALNSEARDPALYEYDEAWLAPRGSTEPERFRERFLQVCEVVRPALVIPCRDEDILFLASLRATLPHSAPPALCGSEATAMAMLDKLASWEFSERHGLPYAQTISCECDTSLLLAFAELHGYPLITKPRQGFASMGVRLLLDGAQVKRMAGVPGYILQRYLGEPRAVTAYAENIAGEGIPLFHSFEAVKLSIQALVGPAGDCLGVCCTHNTMKQGRSEFVEAVQDEQALALGRHCAAVFAREGWRGPLNIQCQVTPGGELAIYEYNGRFTGATAARHLLGYDEVGLALSAFSGIRLPTPETQERCRAIKRVPTSRALDERNVEALIREGNWRKQPPG